MWGLLALFSVLKAVLSPASQPGSITLLRKSALSLGYAARFFRSFETERKQISVLQQEADPHRLAGQLGNFLLAFPRYDPF